MTQAETLPGETERVTKFRFTGIKYESLKVDFNRGEEVEFRVRGKVKMVGDEDMNEGPVHLVKVAVATVVPVSFKEPEDPNQPKLLDVDGAGDEG